MYWCVCGGGDSLFLVLVPLLIPSPHGRVFYSWVISSSQVCVCVCGGGGEDSLSHVLVPFLIPSLRGLSPPLILSYELIPTIFFSSVLGHREWGWVGGKGVFFLFLFLFLFLMVIAFW